MQVSSLKYIGLTFLLIFATAINAAGADLKTRYTTIQYADSGLLASFNSSLSYRNLMAMFNSRSAVSVTEELKGKVDALVEKVETTLEMFPLKLRFNIVLHADKAAVRQKYFTIYGEKTDFFAFYAPTENTIHLSVTGLEVGVLAHEIAHVVIDHHFEVSPSVKIHELLAQYVETQIKHDAYE